MAEKARTLPDALGSTWDRATQHPEPLVALAATNQLWRQWARWQARLAAEALEAGATWDDLGRALGTSRQPAWARLKDLSDDARPGGGTMRNQIRQRRRELQEQVRAIRARVRERDNTWKANRKRLQIELRTTDQQRAADRKALQEEMRQIQRRLRALRDETGGSTDSGGAHDH